MDQVLLGELSQITKEEQVILDGCTTIDRDLYMRGTSNSELLSI